MKKYLLLIMLFVGAVAVNAQENLFSVNGGWAWGNLKDSDGSADGWRISGVYEYNPYGGKLSHGFGLTYISVGADDVTNFKDKSGDVDLRTAPIYYQPKLTFGEGKTRAYLSGALGMHVSGYTISPTEGGSIKTSDAGFYGGLGAGLIVSVSDNIYLNATYEWAYMSNSYYEDGFLQSALIGIAFAF